MSTINGINIFVNDFVVFSHSTFGNTVGKVVRFLVKVELILNIIIDIEYGMS